MKTYTIELGDNLGRGQVMLDGDTIKVKLPDGTIEDTTVRSTEDTFDEYVYAMYGRTPIWDLRVTA